MLIGGVNGLRLTLHFYLTVSDPVRLIADLLDLTEGMADYNDGIAVNEDYPYMYLMRGTLYMEDGDKEKANLDFEQVVAKDTVVYEGTCRHYALHFLGRSEEALDWMWWSCIHTLRFAQ